MAPYPESYHIRTSRTFTMSSESFLTGDLRRAGTEAKRDHDHKAKWAYGGRIALPQKFHVEMGMKLPLTRPIPEHQLAK